MFFQVDRLVGKSQSLLKPIIFSGDSVIYAHTVRMHDPESGTQYDVTEANIIGYPEYTFRTLVPLTDFMEALGGGILGAGAAFEGAASCDVPGGPILVGVSEVLPMVTVRRVMNKIKADTIPVGINPNYIVYAESQVYQDENTELETSGMLILLNSSPPRSVPTNLAFSDLASFLNPVLIS